MKHKLHYLTVLLCVTMFAVNAQNRTVTGTVTSSEDADVVPGVNVLVKGTVIGTITDMDGKFSLKIQSDESILVFSYIGLATQEAQVGSQSILDIIMNPDLQQLNEIVVTALGLEKEKRSLNYATQNVESDVITQSQQPNLATSLQGKIAGLSVRQSSGMPGASILITIRGSSVLSGNNQPLMVVDGLPLESGTVFTDKIASGSNLSNPLFTTYYAPRTYNLWNLPYHTEGDPYNQIHYRSSMDNPRWSLANNIFDEINDRMIGSFNLDYSPLDWFSVKY